MLNGKLVGIRLFRPTGELEYERPLKNGVTHGIEYRSDTPGKLISATPYSNGLPHGTARQWSPDGKLIGTYTMKHGDGIDLWWNLRFEDGSPYLSEARYVVDGKWHGFDWWLEPDQKSLWQERHFRCDGQHGIERRWNEQGCLRRGFPKYWANDAPMTRRQYLRAGGKDPTLPPFRKTDNRPRRKFPPEVAGALRHPS